MTLTTRQTVYLVLAVAGLGATWRRWSVYPVLTFGIAFAFAFPLFLFLRVRRLQARREAVQAMRAKTGTLERRACERIDLSRTVLRYGQRTGPHTAAVR